VTKRIALIFHERQSGRALPTYAIQYLTGYWREEGIDVTVLFGTDRVVPADLAILHIDLSVVPDEYLEFARQYPQSLNSRVKDIRKSSFSGQLVLPDDGYDGPVVVKSDFNYAGSPERTLGGKPLANFAVRLKHRLLLNRPPDKTPVPTFRSPRDYILFETVHSVPAHWFSCKDIVVEKFLPEIEGGLYCTRHYHFLGNTGICQLRRSTEPIVNTATVVSRDFVEPHPEIVETARAMGFDYGKFDYAIHEGKPVLFDINKTPGASDKPKYIEMCRTWAKGIQSYL
jgi:hypothetical protein